MEYTVLLRGNLSWNLKYWTDQGRQGSMEVICIKKNSKQQHPKFLGKRQEWHVEAVTSLQWTLPFFTLTVLNITSDTDFEQHEYKLNNMHKKLDRDLHFFF